MARRSKKSIAEISTSSTKDDALLDGNENNVNPLMVLDRKIVLATEGFTTNRFCEMVLKDRSNE